MQEVWGDIDSAVQVFEKQMRFAVKYYQHSGWSLETAGPFFSAGIARLLGMGESLWACFERLDLVDEEAMRTCYQKTLTLGWLSDDGRHHLSHACFLRTHQYLAGLVAPEGTFDLDALLSDCPEPEASLLSDNMFLTVCSFPARLLLGELFERADMHERALPQVQAAISFSPCSPRLKIWAWLLLGRCHVAMGQKVSR